MKKFVLIFGIILFGLISYSQTKNISSTGGNVVKKDAQGNVVIEGYLIISKSGQIIAFSDSAVDAGTLHAYIQDYVMDSSGLVLITEGGHAGWRLYGFNPAYYGDIGIGAVDFSISANPSATYGATGIYSFARGGEVVASGTYSSANGYQSVASGDKASNANGYVCTVSGESSNVNGANCTVTGTNASNANGNNTTVSGNNGSNANGFHTTTSGDNGANANGSYTTASGNYGANANGSYTTASGGSSSSSGKGYDAANLPEASGVSSFNHQEVENGQGIKESLGANSVILGGKNNETTAAALNSVILGGVGVTLVDPNTVNTPTLKVDTGIIISGSTKITSVSTGAADNDKMITQGHMDDAIEAATGAIVYSTAYSATNYTVLSSDEIVIFTNTSAAKDTCWLPDLYSGKGVWIRRGDNTNDVVITANDLTTDGSTNITNYNMTGTVNSVFCVQESTQWNIIQIGN